MPLSDSIIARLQFQQETIAALCKNFSEEQLKKRGIPDKWSAFENIVHLCAYQPTFLHRIELMITENNPSFERYIADDDQRFLQYQKKSLTELIDITNKDRISIRKKLEGLSNETLARTGQHPRYGKLSIAQWTEFFLLHEAHHLWVVLQLTYSIS